MKPQWHRSSGWAGSRPASPEEAAFLALGEGAQRWLVEASAAGVTRIRSKMARAVELAALCAGRVDQALGLAAIAGRFADNDLASILDHLATTAGTTDEVVRADESHSAQPGTHGWEVFGQ